MAIYFGIISINTSDVPSAHIEQAILNLNQLDCTHISKSKKSFFIYKDLGIWDCRSHYLNNDSVTLLAGDPIYVCNDTQLPYNQTLKRLSTGQQNITKFLENCHGTFSGFHTDQNNESTWIFSDKLGIRPVYYTIQDGLFIFSSALWMFNGVKFVKSTPNLDCLAEVAALGYPLSDHTPYVEIKTINPAEIIEIKNGEIKISNYYSWVTPVNKQYTIAEARNAVENVFSLAVKARLGPDGDETAFLSGGMDSRLITAYLANSNARVNTINFAPSGSQDLEFGRHASEALGTNHFELPLGTEDFDDRQIITIDNWVTKNPEINFNKQIWSGDGGSVGLGHVYLNEDTINASLNKTNAETVELFFNYNKWGIPLNVFRKNSQYLLNNVVESAISEIDKCKIFSSDRSLYFFLLFNDQRRHLSKHFERIHLKKFDFKLPFFDSRLIKTIAQLPVEFFLYHKLYNDILLNLPGKISSIPWQSYPGHITCPITPKNNQTFRYQWDSWHSRSDDRKIAKRNAMDCFSYGINTIFKKSPLNSTNLILAGLLTTTKIRDQAYYASYARPFYKYLHQCSHDT
jgi:asparagine synthase (glutamine-hydrolysing)